MQLLRRQLQLFAWLPLVAVLAMALLPTLSHALAYTRALGAGGWAEVCTQQGPKRIAVDASGQLVDTVVNTAAEDVAMGAAHLQHCPLCALTNDAPPLYSALPLALLMAPASHTLPAAFLHAPRTLHAWRSAQPRGPPSFS